MIKWLFTAIFISNIESFVEYKFRQNYGQVFYDYSGSSRHGVNGASSSTTTGDTTATDRGAYFDISQYITLPSNDISASAFTLTAPFTMVFWLYNQQDNTFDLFSRISSNGNYFFTVGRNSDGNKIIIECKVAGTSTGIQAGSPGGFKKGEWMLITISFSSTQVKVYQNTASEITFSLPGGTYAESGIYTTRIGDAASNLKIFVWYFGINSGVISPSLYVTTAASTLCLTGPGTCACGPGDCVTRFIDPDLGTGYMSSETSLIKDAASTSCSPSTYPCAILISLNCQCASLSCVFSGSGNTCQCMDLPTGALSTATCSCITGYSDSIGKCCEQSCSNCATSTSTVCTACRANNAIPNTTGCKCSNGYFGTTPLMTASACTACYSECATCTSYGPCLTCVATYATKVTGGNGCTCNSGYQGTSPLNTAASCYTCYTECYTCSSPTLCITCKASLAVPDSTQGCYCPTGTYSAGSPLITAGACIACHQECLTCTQALICSTCIASLAIIDSTQGCYCPVGTYSTGSPLITATACVACHQECSSCVQDLKCVTCKASLASIDTIQGCYCPIGTYPVSVPLISTGSCAVCHQTCAECTEALKCSVCKPNLVQTNTSQGCICLSGSYLDGNLCKDCHTACLTCSGSENYQCLTCKNLILDGTCIDLCPLGYIANNTQCIVRNNLAVKFFFDSTENMNKDSIQGLKSTGGVYISANTNADQRVPILSFERGVYFTGEGSFLLFPNTSEPFLMFGLRYFVSMWINPMSSTATIIYKEYNSTVLFSIKSINSKLIVTLALNQNYNYTSTSLLRLEEWNHIALAVTFVNGTSIQFTLNQNQEQKIFFSQTAFLDRINSTILLGSTKATTDYFKGFIYSLELYIDSPPISSLSSLSCNNCNICLASNTCLPNCDISSFYNHSLSKCELCLPECKNGCRNQFNCNMCASHLCKVCKDFVSTSCTQCYSPYDIVGTSCVPCNSSSYYNEALLKCIACDRSCTSCKDSNTCDACIQNSHKTEASVCECDKGYQLNEKCERIKFKVSMTINSENIISLIFTESLKTNLTIHDISVLINSNPHAFNIEFIDSFKYNIITEFNSMIQEDDRIFIVFIQDIVSESNSLLDREEVFSFRLFPKVADDNQILINSTKKYTKIGVTASVSATLVLSSMNLDPSSFFNFLNSAELFTYIIAYKVEIHPMLTAFLDSIQVISRIPNIFSETISETYGVLLPKKYAELNGSTNLFIINSGVNLMVLSFVMAAIPAAWLMSKVKLPRNIQVLKRLWQGFAYNIFLRFFIQSCLELVFNCSISLIYNDLSNPILIADFAVSIIILTANIVTFCLLLWLIKNRSQLYGNTSALEDYNKKFGAFFDEFKENNASESFYYVLFVVRRYAIVIGILFIDSAITQLCISVIFGLATLFYLIEVKPYKDVIANIYMISIEIVTSLFYITLIISTVPGSNLDLASSSYCCMLLLVIAIASNILSALISAVIKLLAYLKKKRSLRVSTAISDISIPTSPQVNNPIKKRQDLYIITD